MAWLPPAASRRQVARNSSTVDGISRASGLTLLLIEATAGVATRAMNVGRAHGRSPVVRRSSAYTTSQTMPAATTDAVR